MARVKICGINDPAALAAATEAGADWVAFNFFPPSPRAVTPDQAAAISASASSGPARVGLFVEPTDGQIEATLGKLRLDILQLYVAAERAAEIKRRFGLAVWRAVGVARPADLPGPGEAIDGYIIEPKPAPGVTRPGGNATRFDWTIPQGWAAPLPWLLAGGLDPDNVVEAIQTSGAAAVDVSSGVERQRGVKDPALIAAFTASARGC